MPPERDAVHLWDMITAARGIMASAGSMSFQEYQADENLRLAVERRLEIIGEAARRISDSLKAAHPEILWRAMIDQRNVLVHEYDEIDDLRIWNLARKEIPQLIDLLEPLLPRAED